MIYRKIFKKIKTRAISRKLWAYFFPPHLSFKSRDQVSAFTPLNAYIPRVLQFNHSRRAAYPMAAGAEAVTRLFTRAVFAAELHSVCTATHPALVC